MKMSKISTKKYIEFKTALYKLYIRSIENPDSNLVERKRLELDQRYNNEYLNKLYDTTMMCPFDLELSNYLENSRSIPKEALLEASLKYGIPVDVVKLKLEEYVNYRFSYLYKIGLIDQDVVSKLSELYTEKEEKTK